MQEPIRILMLFTIMNRGGAETMVMNYYRNIDRTKVQFDFMVHREERGAYDDEIEALGGRIYRMMPLHPFTFGKYQKQIVKFFDEHKEYKIIHGHCSESGYFIYKEASRRGIPVIIAHAHSNKALFDHKWFFRTLFKHLMRPYITKVFTCAKESAYWLAGKNKGEKAILQRNAIDTFKYTFDSKKALRIRKSLKISEKDIVIGHIGSFWKLKNQTFLIDIINLLKQYQPNIKLLLIGEGELRKRVEQKVNLLNLQDNVLFLGSRNDVPELLNALDLFILPSLGEGFSIVTLEAQCSGLPCLVSNVLPKEVVITDLVKFLDLKDNLQTWVNMILTITKTSNNKNRTIYSQIIKENGYDIKGCANWLQNYYLEQWQKH